MTRRDVFILVIMGGMVAVFTRPIILHLGVELAPPGAWLLMLGVPAVYLVAGWVGWQIGHWFPAFWQVTKFIAVGVLNVAIDFGVLNLISLTTGIVAGAGVGGINVFGFVLALSNSYVWNKWWVFRGAERPWGGEAVRFIAVNVSALIFVSVSLALITRVTPPLGLRPAEWENVVKAMLTVLAAAGTFSGLKFLVFKQ